MDRENYRAERLSNLLATKPRNLNTKPPVLREVKIEQINRVIALANNYINSSDGLIEGVMRAQNEILLALEKARESLEKGLVKASPGDISKNRSQIESLLSQVKDTRFSPSATLR